MALLKERTLSVVLTLSAWRAQRVDRKVTNEVLDAHHAERDAGRFNKHLVPKEAIAPVRRAQGSARAAFQRLSLPWLDDGIRIITNEMFMDFRQAMSKERSECEAAYDQFALIYPDLKQQAPKRLNGMYDPADFPDEIRDRFGFELKYVPVTDEMDFRGGAVFEDEIKQELETNYRTTLQKTVGSADYDLVSRLLKLTEHFTNVTGVDDQRFEKTTVENLRELARIAPKLSLTKNPVVEQTSQQILDLLDGVDATLLRNNKQARAQAHTAAKKVTRTLKASEEAARKKLAELDRRLGIA